MQWAWGRGQVLLDRGGSWSTRNFTINLGAQEGVKTLLEWIGAFRMTGPQGILPGQKCPYPMEQGVIVHYETTWPETKIFVALWVPHKVPSTIIVNFLSP